MLVQGTRWTAAMDWRCTCSNRCVSPIFWVRGRRQGQVVFRNWDWLIAGGRSRCVSMDGWGLWRKKLMLWRCTEKTACGAGRAPVIRARVAARGARRAQDTKGKGCKLADHPPTHTGRTSYMVEKGAAVPKIWCGILSCESTLLIGRAHQNRHEWAPARATRQLSEPRVYLSTHLYAAHAVYG